MIESDYFDKILTGTVVDNTMYVVGARHIHFIDLDDPSKYTFLKNKGTCYVRPDENLVYQPPKSIDPPYE
jgi:hypothetical protein